MKTLLSAAALCLAMGAAHAQSPRVTNADILGIGFQTSPEQAIALLKKQYPKMKVSTTKREVSAGNLHIYYDAMYEIVLEQNPDGAVITGDYLHLNYLPDGSLAGASRTIVFRKRKQFMNDIVKSLTQKYGDPVFQAPGTNTETAEVLWSDRMQPGLMLIGTQYQQAGGVYTTNPGITPYPQCRGEMLRYTDELFKPAELTRSPNHQPMWKSCGTVVNLLIYSDGYQLYADRIEMRIANVSGMPEVAARMGELIAKNPAHQKMITAGSEPERPINAPKF
ncbi:hypothetical protein ACLB1G_21070 [Oxalobacteraceae bacterium A2-2]